MEVKFTLVDQSPSAMRRSPTVVFEAKVSALVFVVDLRAVVCLCVQVPPPPPLTVTVALATGEVPPAPVQVMEYVVVTVGETDVEPEVPDAVKLVPEQLVALVLLHVSVDDCPLVMEVGFAESVAVGTGFPACVVALAVLELPELFPAASYAET